MAVPIVEGDALTQFSLVSTRANGETEDLFRSVKIYPPSLSPFDRPELVCILLRSGLLLHHFPDRPSDDFRLVGSLIISQNTLDSALERLLSLMKSNGSDVVKIQLVALRWASFRDFRTQADKPTERRVILSTPSDPA